MGLFGKGKKDDGAQGGKPAPQAASKLGHIKLIGIAGLVKGEEFTVEPGKAVVIGRSSECDICLRNVPRARDLDDSSDIIAEHFRTVSRKHLRLTYLAPNNIELEDLSSNGSFLDGQRIEGKATVADVVTRKHELKLGTHETFALDWWELVPKSSLKMVKVKVIRQAAPEGEEAKDGEKKDGDGKDAAKDGGKPAKKDAK